jgi:hypothetical protein
MNTSFFQAQQRAEKMIMRISAFADKLRRTSLPAGRRFYHNKKNPLIT